MISEKLFHIFFSHAAHAAQKERTHQDNLKKGRKIIVFWSENIYNRVTRRMFYQYKFHNICVQS